MPTADSLYTLNDNAAANSVLRLSPAINTYQKIDLASLHGSVAGGTTIASALADLLDAQLPGTIVYDSNDPTKVTGFKVTGSDGTKVEIAEGEPRHYNLDFGSYLKDHPELKLPDDLDMKGFRVYCATDSSQWFNFEFINGLDGIDKKPLSGTSTDDIRSLLIDVSGVTDAASLVKTIYTQIQPQLTGGNRLYNHLIRLAGDTESGVLTIYDDRRFPVDSPVYTDKQERGAKIGTGIMDNVVLSKRNVYADDLVIQDTDHASQNIHIKIPRTTLDHVLGYNIGSYEPEDFNVLTKESRDALLGVPPDKGTLDKGLDYLIDANTLIGAQINRLRMSGANITTARENVQASESVIRDADMAQAITAFAKDNILSQASQAMLAQSNQNASSVLSLLS